MSADVKRLGGLGDQSSPETYGGGVVYQHADGSAFLEYTLGAECEEGAFAPDKPEPLCSTCLGAGEVPPSDEDDDIDDTCPTCHGKGHLFAFDVYRVDLAADVLADLDWVNWSDVARSIGMPEAELRSYAVSPEPLARASVYEAVAQHHGWHELDSYPIQLTEWELEQRWNKETSHA